jgi:thioredoxin reductase
VLDSGERVDTRRLVLADGVRDTLPGIDGLAELFGVSVFTCPYCDGFEGADAALGLICTARCQLEHAAGLVRDLSDDVTVFANGITVADDELDAAARLGARVVAPPVVRLRSTEGQPPVVVLADGSEHRGERVFVPTEVHRSSRWAEQLGCAVKDGFVDVDELGRTSVARVYAAGDTASPVHRAIVAAASGMRAALAANHDAIHSFELD